MTQRIPSAGCGRDGNLDMNRPSAELHKNVDIQTLSMKAKLTMNPDLASKILVTQDHHKKIASSLGNPNQAAASLALLLLGLVLTVRNFYLLVLIHWHILSTVPYALD
jgi:hypothetical protein